MWHTLGVSLSPMIRALQSLIEELEHDRSLAEPDRLRERIEALDSLDAYLLDEDLPTPSAHSPEAELYRRVIALCTRLEAANSTLYQSIRSNIQQGAGHHSLLRWVSKRSARDGEAVELVDGPGYDYLDELVSGVLQFEKPGAESVRLAPEMVFYQPTPARHIFDLIERIALTERDVLVDLGSGMGHVPLLVSICTDARCVGIELQPAYVECARESARALQLKNVAFFQQDARVADLSGGTVFYLYTPFTGTILRDLLDSLRREAAGREIRICTFGPCMPTIGAEQWLEPVGSSETDRISIFRSRN
jgi:Histone methylation protein DOT1